MRTVRQRRQQQQQLVRKTAAAPIAQQPARQTSRVGVSAGRQPVREKKQELKKMEEEHAFSEDEYSNEEVPEVTAEEECREMRKEVASEVDEEFKPDSKLCKAIRARYSELTKELWDSQGKLDEFNFSEEEKNIINNRVKIWLEYFVSTATFRKDNVNLFEYMDSFTETQKFI